MNDSHVQRNTPRLLTHPATEDREDNLADLKGKGPREVLGALPPARLDWALGVATLVCAVVMVVLTVIPHALSKSSDAGDKKASAGAEQKTDQDTTKPPPKDPAQTKNDDKKPATADARKDQGKPSKDLVDKLKENDVKKDKPKDPFATIDDLLDKK